MKVNKVRLDVLLVDRGLAETREKAKRSIMAGLVFSDTERLDKPGVKVNEDIPLTVKGKVMPYVGRGGLKLEKALSYFKLDVTGRVMLDIGSSTGGFTDCGLMNGVKLSYALDVGYNQLAWKLRNDPRVVVMERTNFRHATLDMFKEGQPDFATIDVSFISLSLIIPPLKAIIALEGDCVVLIKPQFEAGRDQVGKKGIVKDKQVHHEVLAKVLKLFYAESFNLIDLTYSPITGGDGNIEFLAHIQRVNNPKLVEDVNSFVDNVVEEAHVALKK
ncbi:23S rRNA (cytidine1920-2'-O)/16S rRNA (cytidine1409-2'-O)-methyltransferase [Streptohalobacillus salinus]|uniref:23S rRNA (Cytidine1920-2'-O)/16S rRNA (Cytidine1409-2'-O)-methyltransferase n=1 Tax=Streptohalobacillus salinus TaxID=621096 RepID=A0A2V3WDW3_9BACI|nr:TlyA family RNA methyltransferase [Streptohalobacillus salinus]PXW91676.1 23S rRNA (cytidine1920-2'-O)/16S rRNA (cytidine1409-2'-O)-methyltransferase [Streptohalobacillus salinus]